MIMKEIFPTVIGTAFNKSQPYIRRVILNRCRKIKETIPSGGANWISTVYNTDGTHLVHEDPEFDSLTKWVYEEVMDYAGRLGYFKKRFACTNSWINYYKKVTEK